MVLNFLSVGHIIIYGTDVDAVQRAREQLELKEEKCKITQQQLEWISHKANGNIIGEFFLVTLSYLLYVFLLV